MLDVAILGLGWWGRTIVQTLRDHPRLRITTALDPNPAAAEFAAGAGIHLAENLDQILQDPALHGVIICTPHSLHAAQINAVAAAGKHVFCEKPLCLTKAEAETAVAACAAAGVVLGVGHERRFEPPIIALRQMVARGELGEVLQIEANFSQDKFLSLPPDNWRLSAAEAPAGPMTATGIHLLDLSVSLLGAAESAVVRVRQLGSQLANGDTLAAMVGFRSGPSALISAILATPFDGRFAVYGSKGWAEVRDKAHPETPQGWVLTRVLRGDIRSQTEFVPAPAVRANLEAWAEAALGGAPYPVPPEQMVQTVAALEAVFRAAASGQPETVG